MSLGSVGRLHLRVRASALLGTILLWVLLSVLAAWWTNLPITWAIATGFAGTIGHWLSEFMHHWGHGWAARRTGHPMSGVEFGTYLLLGKSLYPPDEGELPGYVHMQRALGGPAVSMAIGIAAGAFLLLLNQPLSDLERAIQFLLWFLFIDNALFLGLGAFLPLGFTDGSTILQYWGK